MLIKEITNKEQEFPQTLRIIPHPPKKIYALGNTKLLSTPCLAIVGSRKCTSYGEKMALHFAQQLSQYNLTIVSGLALGIDSFAHQGALQAGGKTIAVLPSGINKIYPEENKSLAINILRQNGLILSEYAPNETIKSEYFLARNRIVCGLSLGTLIIEGAYRSGTSVTAKQTKEQGKPIFCLPSSLENPKGYTPNHLIQQGNQLIMKVEDIIHQFPDHHFTKYKPMQKEKRRERKEDKLLNWISNNPIHINELAQKEGKKVEELSYPLMKLILAGKIQELPGKNFIRR